MGAGSWFQSFAALAFVLALVWGAAFLMRRMGIAKPMAASPLRTVATVSVGARERVALIETGDTWLVVGVAPGRVQALHVMPRGEMPAAQAATPGANVPPSFDALLKRFRND